MKTHLRRASDNDYRTFYRREPEEGLVGFAAERDGAIVAFGYAWVDAAGRTWVGVDRVHEVPVMMLHRAIAAFIAAMQAEGIPALYALCDERIPTATRWLTKLGFAIDDAMPCVYMPVVEKSLPVWRRVFDNGMER